MTQIKRGQEVDFKADHEGSGIVLSVKDGDVVVGVGRKGSCEQVHIAARWSDKFNQMVVYTDTDHVWPIEEVEVKMPEMTQLFAEAIQWGYQISAECGMKPDPDDTVRVLMDQYMMRGQPLPLTEEQMDDIAERVAREFDITFKRSKWSKKPAQPSFEVGDCVRVEGKTWEGWMAEIKSIEGDSAQVRAWKVGGKARWEGKVKLSKCTSASKLS